MTEAGKARLDGRVALVTGASRGIGRAIALELAGAGAKVVANYSQAEDAANSLVGEIEAAGGDAVPVQADVAKTEDCERLVEAVLTAYGQVDVLVNNAGINRDRLLMRMSPLEWQSVIDTDLTSAFNMIRLVVPAMRKQGWGRIVNIASIIGQTGNVGQANYAAAKAGLIALTKTAAQELARFGITVNALCPGFVETDMVNQLTDDQKAAILAKIPLGRMGRPEEVASFCRYLVTEGGWITGQQLNVNGGQYM
jgi:3-oxoacyl-[acyl-carrier protein] reductase